MTIPASIAAFMEAQAVSDVLCLPQYYPAADSFEAFQAGYRYHAITAENLTGSRPGDFREDWYVVCSNYFDDPFIVDFSEGDAGYPVYYAPHGAGEWKLVNVAKTVAQFATMLQGLALVADDAPRAIALINSFPFSEEAFWREAKESIAEGAAEE